MSKIITALYTVSFLIFSASNLNAEVSDETRIREIRASSNQAFLDRDIEVLKTTWRPDLQVTGSNGQVVRDGKTMAAIITALFKEPEFITFVRTPIEVKLSPGRHLAAESGEWSGHWLKKDGKMAVRGTYLAQWHKHADQWKIRSEVFIALSCSGSAACADLP